MKSPLRAKREALAELWQEGLTGNSLLLSQSNIADEFIVSCFEEGDLGDLTGSVALVALGGYGRRELYPFSDIDIMILFKPEVVDEVGKVADAVLYPLWDTGLEVGHGVRTIAESMQHAQDDFYFRVAMIDARFLTGSEDLFIDLQENYKRDYVNGKRKEFVRTMQGFRDERREKYGSHSYLLEPHIKDGKGGLRDIQAMMWTSQVVFGLSGLEGISDAGLLMEDERVEFEKSWNLLVQLRNRLHYISKRKNDQLFFEQQEDMADAFGHATSDGVLGVEGFMREVYANLQTVAVVTDLFFDHVDEVLGIGSDSRECFPNKLIEKGLEIRSNRIQLVAQRKDLEAKPHMLLRVFLAAARVGAPIHHRTLRAVSANLDLISDKIRLSSRMSRAFLAVLMEARDIFPVLESMLETGLLQAYIPEFLAIDTLAQHDIYHIFTVDRHSLQATAELAKALEEETHASVHVESTQVLYLATLLHDIGKGSGKDHSEYGAELVVGIGKRFGFSESEVECLSFLVRYHLYIPENALRRDLDDAAFIKRCAGEIGSIERLAMLYLIAVADSKATGPSAWSEWKASLMLDMFFKIKPHFDENGLALQEDSILANHAEEGVDWLRGQVAALLRKEKGLKIGVEDLTSDYLVNFTPEKVAEHVCIYSEQHRVIRQKSLVFASEEEGHWSLLIMSNDQPGLLSKICGVMALNNLNVINAQIFTWADGTAVDVIDVRSTDGLTFDEKDWESLNNDLDLAIARRLGLGHRLFQKLSSTYGRRFELSGNIEPRIVVDNKSSDQFSVIEVYSTDVPGQLYHITQTLADFGVNIYKAFIATEVEQLIDVFYVLDRQGSKIFDATFQEEITQGLLYAIGRTTK